MIPSTHARPSLFPFEVIVITVYMYTYVCVGAVAEQQTTRAAREKTGLRRLDILVPDRQPPTATHLDLTWYGCSAPCHCIAATNRWGVERCAPLHSHRPPKPSPAATELQAAVRTPDAGVPNHGWNYLLLLSSV